MTSQAMLNTAIAWTPLPWTLCCQTPLCPGDSMIHPKNTLEEPSTSYHLAELLDQYQFPCDQLTCLLGTCHPPTHTYEGVAAACRRTTTPSCGTLAMSKSPAMHDCGANQRLGIEAISACCALANHRLGT